MKELNINNETISGEQNFVIMEVIENTETLSQISYM